MALVLLLAGDTLLILWLDANACSPLLFSKMPKPPTGLRSQIRDEVLSEWCISRSVQALKESSEFSFHGTIGASDIDVTIANKAARFG